MVEVANKDPVGQPAAVIQLNIDARAGRAIAEYIRPAGALEHAQAAIIARERKRDLAGGDGDELVILAGGEGWHPCVPCMAVRAKPPYSNTIILMVSEAGLATPE